MQGRKIVSELSVRSSFGLLIEALGCDNGINRELLTHDFLKERILLR